MAAHVDAPQPFELAVVPSDRLGEGAVDIQTNDPHPCSSVSVRKDATIKTYHYDDLGNPKPAQRLVTVDNFAKHLKALRVRLKTG
jgi:hypothetical protein